MISRRRPLTHHGGDYTPCEGLEVTGSPVTTTVRVPAVFEAARPAAELGHGTFLPRGASGRM